MGNIIILDNGDYWFRVDKAKRVYYGKHWAETLYLTDSGKWVLKNDSPFFHTCMLLSDKKAALWFVQNEIPAEELTEDMRKLVYEMEI